MTDPYQEKIIANYPAPTQEKLDQLALALAAGQAERVEKPKKRFKVWTPWSRLDELVDQFGASLDRVRADIKRLNERDKEAA